MLGVCLLFVGIVLINNGMCTLYNVDGKSTSVMNIFTGGLSLFINFVNLVQGNYYAAGTGLLFCFTYLFVAFSRILKLSPIPFAWFSTFVAINAVVFGTIEGFLGSKTLGITPDIRCGRHHGQKTGKICSGAPGDRRRNHSLGARSDAAPWSIVRIEEKIYAL